ncbi:MAG: DUF2119 domain-containing protein [ANME-2 cluster archaeon]|nr:DUF2119 domain-containing protein [ANME-2 cluster archaeon]
MIQRFGSGDPVRLFVAGLHGDEWETTSALLEQLSPPGTGTLIIMPKVSDNEYLSTLDRDYYATYAPHLREAIVTFRPSIYLELHCYSKESYLALVGDGRFERYGVPAYIEIEAGILMGSVSPRVRRDFFTPDDLCVSFEMPRNPSELSLIVIHNLLDVVEKCWSRQGFVSYMAQHYPEQTAVAVKNYLQFYGHLY